MRVTGFVATREINGVTCWGMQLHRDLLSSLIQCIILLDTVLLHLHIAASCIYHQKNELFELSCYRN